MPLPAIALTGFIGSIAAAITNFALSKAGHWLAALGLGFFAYKGLDNVWTEFINLYNTYQGALGGSSIHVMGQSIPIGSILLSFVSLLGIPQAINLIVSAAISAFSFKALMVTFRRLNS